MSDLTQMDLPLDHDFIVTVRQLHTFVCRARGAKDAEAMVKAELLPKMPNSMLMGIVRVDLIEKPETPEVPPKQGVGIFGSKPPTPPRAA